MLWLTGIIDRFVLHCALGQKMEWSAGDGGDPSIEVPL